MENGKGPGRLRGLNTYLPIALRFYDLKKSEHLTPVIFIILLSGAFLPAFFNSISNESFTYFLIMYFFITSLFSTVYLCACIKEFKGESYSFSSCIGIVSRRIFIIIFATMIFGLFLTLGFILFVIPCVIIYLTLLFYACFIVDREQGIIQAFRSSRNITYGRKWQILGVMLTFALLELVLVMVQMTTPLQTVKSLAFNFVMSFFSVIVSLMQQRIIAQMYVDLEYPKQYEE